MAGVGVNIRQSWPSTQIPLPRLQPADLKDVVTRCISYLHNRGNKTTTRLLSIRKWRLYIRGQLQHTRQSDPTAYDQARLQATA